MLNGSGVAAGEQAEQAELAGLPAKVIELEIKLSYAEDQIDALNRAIYLQAQQMDRLQLELHAMRQQMQANAPADVRSLRDELPPHY